MLHFLPPMNQTCFAAKQVVGGCRKQKVVAVSREKFFFFATKSVHVACLTGPRRTCFAASDVTNSRVIVSN